ncbi:MAG: hypothetical protein SWO11_13940 [Thermodesulfobacteriota bacterium]|nr:hypothetical protein [Thermodesulfobacteriota bacterium]
MVFKYILELDNGEKCHFEINTAESESNAVQQEEHPAWTSLENFKCQCCPLQNYKYCPAAVDIEKIAERFRKVLSWERVKVTVQTDARIYQIECDTQKGLMSLYGLMMANSNCPILSRMKPLARTHVPIPTEEEIITRVVGTYLIKQYLLYKNHSVKPDWDLSELIRLYDDLQQVNLALSKRLRSASEADANINAIISFHSISSIFALELENMLEQMRDLLMDGF